jgi:hypothetical protein
VDLKNSFSKEFVEEVRNVIFYLISWRNNGYRKIITCLLLKDLSSNLYNGFLSPSFVMVGFGGFSPIEILLKIF